MNPYQRKYKALQQAQTQKSLLLHGVQEWLTEQTRKSLVFPLTLEFQTGPWLYEKQGEDKLSRTAPLEKEIGVFMERLYRFGTRESQRSRKDGGWSYLCWPDTGGPRGFLHYHGFLIVSHGKWSETEPDFKVWFEGFKARLSQTSVTHAHLSAPVVSEDSVKTFSSYASRRNVGDPFWYKAGQLLPVLQWSRKLTRSRVEVWTSGDYAICHKSPTPFSVRITGVEVYTCATLKDAFAWCEAHYAAQPKSL